MRALEEAGSAQIEQRVARFLLSQACDNQVRITQVGIASELGTAREVVFRSLRSLAEHGLIERGRGRIRILDAAGLARHARGR
jgi:CRP/FNR family transcriptional regulator